MTYQVLAVKDTAMKRCSLVMLSLMLLVPAAAFAHGATPLASDVMGVGDSQWVLQTNFGVVTSAWPNHYVCEEAFAGGQDFQMAPVGVNEWLLFNHDNVIYSPDGCTFETRQDLPRKPAGVAVTDDHTRVAYLLNVDTDPSQSGVWWSDDAAETVHHASLDVSSLHLSRAVFLDDARLLVSGYSSDNADRGAARLVIVNLDDDSTTDVAGTDGLKYPYVFDAASDWIVWLARDGQAQKVFWGPIDDAARYATEVASWPSGAALSDDGQTVWISGALDQAHGLVVGDTSADPVFSDKLADHSALCVSVIGGDHYLCARRDREGHDLSRVGADGNVEAVVNFANMQGPRTDCPADSPAVTTCATVWPQLAAALNIDVGPQAGSDVGADAGVDAGDAGTPGIDKVQTTDDAGCSATGGGAPVGWVASVVLLGLALWSRRRAHC